MLLKTKSQTCIGGFLAGRCAPIQAPHRGTAKKLADAGLPVSSVPGTSTSKVPAASPSSGSFPKVSSDDQRARDSDRRKLLETELATEEAALEAARKALEEADAVRYGNERNYQKKLDRMQPFQDAVAQHERNIEALRKELSNLR